MAQRNEMQEDLDETVKEHIYNMQIEGLDDMMDGLQEDLQEWKDKLHADLDMQTSAINDILKQLNGDSASAISTLLSDISGKLISSDDVTSILKEASKTMSNYNTYNIDNNYSGENVDGSNKTNEGASNNVDKAPTTSTTFETSANPNSSDKAPIGNVANNPTAQYGEKTASGYVPATLTTNKTTSNTTTTATPKQTVTTAQANAAYNYIKSKLKYASSQNNKWGKFNKALYNHSVNRQIMLESSDAQTAWAKFGSGVGSYSPEKLLDVAQKTGIWDALLGIKTNKKQKKITSFPTIGVNQIHGYAKGGTVHKSGQYLTDEKGEEIIITKQGILRPLSAGTSVIPADITERLYAIASNYDMGANTRVHGIDASKLTRIGGDTISPIINCPITIEGNANEQDVINAINKTLPKISKHVQNDIRKDLRKSGR